MSTPVDLSQLAIDRSGSPAHGGQQRRHLLTRYVLPALLLVGFAALVAWAARDWMFPPRRVTVVPVLATRTAVQQEGTPLFKAAGWVEPRPTPTRVAALAPGVVEKLLVVEDQALQAGDVVAELVKADAQLAFERAAADHALNQAQLDETSAAVRAATTRLAQPVHLQAALAEAEAALAKVATELKNLPFESRRAQARYEFAAKNYAGKQAASEGVAARIVLEAKSDMEAALALVEELDGRAPSLALEQAAIKQRRDALAQQLELLADERQAKETATAQAKAAEARVEQTRVALEQARLQLGRMTVRAPIDGRVYQLISSPGSTLAGNMPKSENVDSSTVVTMYRPEMLQVRVDVRFEDLPKISRGQQVRIENPALHSALTGEVLFISSEADIQKNTLQVKVAMQSPPPVFKPEMLVDVTFLAPATPDKSPAASQAERLFVPRRLVLSDAQGEFVWVADQSAKVARRTGVKTTPAAPGEMLEVTRGLSMSSRLIADGHEGLRDGLRIEIVGETTTTASAGGQTPRANRSRLPETGEHQ